MEKATGESNEDRDGITDVQVHTYMEARHNQQEKRTERTEQIKERWLKRRTKSKSGVCPYSTVHKCVSARGVLTRSRNGCREEWKKYKEIRISCVTRTEFGQS